MLDTIFEPSDVADPKKNKLLDFSRGDIARYAYEEIDRRERAGMYDHEDYDVRANRMKAAEDRFNVMWGPEAITGAPTARETLGDFAGALTEFYKIANNPKAKGSAEHIAALGEALGVLEKNGYVDDANT
jgi:hypothetical protein